MHWKFAETNFNLNFIDRRNVNNIYGDFLCEDMEHESEFMLWMSRFFIVKQKKYMYVKWKKIFNELSSLRSEKHV